MVDVFISAQDKSASEKDKLITNPSNSRFLQRHQMYSKTSSYFRNNDSGAYIDKNTVTNPSSDNEFVENVETSLKVPTVQDSNFSSSKVSSSTTSVSNNLLEEQHQVIETIKYSSVLKSESQLNFLI